MSRQGFEPHRRLALGLGGAGMALIVAGCGHEATGEDISATEDLMREHGVLRRILVLYRRIGDRLSTGDTGFDAAGLGQAADLFRRFGEDYHERELEERRLFPTVQKAGGAAAGLIGVLLSQHQRGREITAYVQAKCVTGKVALGDAAPLGSALNTMARMYEAHTAFEDTIVFPAWKKAISKHDLKEASEEFERIEKAQFKGDGFDQALEQMTQIEQRLGMSDLAAYTAPPVPESLRVTDTTTVRGPA